MYSRLPGNWYREGAQERQLKKRVVDIPKEALLSMLFFKGRVYNNRRIELSNNYYGVHALQRSQLKGFGKKIQDMILN